jgi:transcriptional regulator with XRE-family HTH domain
MAMTSTAAPGFGDLLRRWRSQRRLSQLDLASQAGVSPRHLSFVETGRANASREMVLHLAEQLDVPLRERNALLVAAGYAPVFSESSLEEPQLASIKHAIEVMLRNHEPMPALVVDRRWDLVDANAGVALFLTMIPPSLLEPPVNVIRVSLHPDGLASRIANLDEYATHLLERLRRQLEASGDAALAELLDEVAAFPAVRASPAAHDAGTSPGVVLPMQVRLDGGELLSFFSTMTVFGAPLDVTLSELALESFFPADEATGRAVRRLVEGA